MEGSKNFEIIVKHYSAEVILNGKLFLKRFWRRRFILFGPFQMRDERRTLLMTFDHAFTRSFSRDCEITVNDFHSGHEHKMKFFWKKPHGVVDIDSHKFLIVFHTGMRISIFRDDFQVAQINVPRLELLGEKRYRLVAKTSENLDTLFLLVFAIIYKLQVCDSNDDAATVVFELGLIGPFQSELQAFDDGWLEKPYTGTA